MSAAERLAWYLRKAWEAAGLDWTSDNDMEVDDIVAGIQNEMRRQDAVRALAETEWRPEAGER
jgi:hypothetical protein